jgi:adenylate cyclase
MPVKTLLRNLRLISGLVLMAFVISHLLNLSLGLHSLSAMGQWRPVLLDPWRNAVGGTALAAAALVHTVLGLVAIGSRRSLAMTRTDKVQMVLGVLTPPMLITHVVATHIAAEFGRDFQFVYGQMLAVYWSFAPRYAFQQLFVVLIVWVHGALGLYSWLVLKPVWRRIGGIVLPLLFLIPILALLGFAEGGREVLQRLESDPAWKALIIDHLRPIAAMVAQTDAAKNVVLAVYGCVVGLTFLLVLVRILRDRARPVQVAYDGGLVGLGRRGLSVLEISQANDIAHAHVCSARGRCGTCRVLVSSGESSLTPLNDLEEATLARLHAETGMRLACQARVLGPGVVVTRVLPAFADASAASDPLAWMEEVPVAPVQVAP